MNPNLTRTMVFVVILLGWGIIVSQSPKLPKVDFLKFDGHIQAQTAAASPLSSHTRAGLSSPFSAARPFINVGPSVLANASPVDLFRCSFVIFSCHLLQVGPFNSWYCR
jgi:hypothetical protein